MAISSAETANAREDTEHSWILVRSVRQLWHDFRTEQRALPDDARHRFWFRMGIGLLLTVAIPPWNEPLPCSSAACLSQ